MASHQGPADVLPIAALLHAPWQLSCNDVGMPVEALASDSGLLSRTWHLPRLSESSDCSCMSDVGCLFWVMSEVLGFQLYPFLMAHVASAVVAAGLDSNSAQTSLRLFMTSSSLWTATAPVSEPITAALVSSTSGLTSGDGTVGSPAHLAELLAQQALSASKMIELSHLPTCTCCLSGSAST